jgi:arsenate reductase
MAVKRRKERSMTGSTRGLIRVLFLCTHNSARSQMAEAFLRHYGEGRFDVHSAGTELAVAIHPLAEAVLRSAGIALAGQYPKHLDRYTHERWDYVITTCDDANEACPAFPDDPERIHWGFPDPSAVTGTPEEREQAFRRVRNEIKRRVQLFVSLRAHREGRPVAATITHIA